MASASDPVKRDQIGRIDESDVTQDNLKQNMNPVRAHWAYQTDIHIHMYTPYAFELLMQIQIK